MDINSIIEMINNTVRPIEKVHSPYRVGYDDACDDIIEQLRKMSDAQDEGWLCEIPNPNGTYRTVWTHEKPSPVKNINIRKVYSSKAL